MASIFGRDHTEQPPPSAFAKERIEKEIAHLKKGQSTRKTTDERKTMAIFVSFVAITALLTLYFLDPFLFAWHKGDAIQAYLYLHNYDSEKSTVALAESGILSEPEIRILNHKQGSFQDYFPSHTQAEDKAETIVNYMEGVHNLHAGSYDKLDFLGKIRYDLFYQTGLLPPIQWQFLNPPVEE